MTQNVVSERAKIKRLKERASYDRRTIDPILDQAFICHVGFCVDGRPVVLPMAFARRGDELLIHGSVRGRLLDVLGLGVEACAVVTHFDGLVLARSLFHHSMNYRSAVVFGRTALIAEVKAKRQALIDLSERLTPGRVAHVREPNAQELKATSIVSLSIEDASAKSRSGFPIDAGDDLGLEVWAGVVPFSLSPGVPERDPLRAEAGDEVGLPEHIRRLLFDDRHGRPDEHGRRG